MTFYAHFDEFHFLKNFGTGYLNVSWYKFNFLKIGDSYKFKSKFKTQTFHVRFSAVFMSLLLVRKDSNIILILTWLNSEVWLCELNPVSTILNWNSSFALDLFVRFKMIQELFPRHNFYLISYKKYVQGTLRASDKFWTVILQSTLSARSNLRFYWK